MRNFVQATEYDVYIYAKFELIWAGKNMRNFVQATEYDVYIYAKFEWLDAYRFL
jgi:hypothetical protein